MRVDFVLGRGKTSSPKLQTADSFNAFRQRIMAKRTTIAITPDISAQTLRAEKAKLFWFAPPVKEAGMQRIKENMAACAFGGYDFDACTPGAVRKLTDHLRSIRPFPIRRPVIRLNRRVYASWWRFLAWYSPVSVGQ